MVELADTYIISNKLNVYENGCIKNIKLVIFIYLVYIYLINFRRVIYYNRRAWLFQMRPKYYYYFL